MSWPLRGRFDDGHLRLLTLLRNGLATVDQVLRVEWDGFAGVAPGSTDQPDLDAGRNIYPAAVPCQGGDPEAPRQGQAGSIPQ